MAETDLDVEGELSPSSENSRDSALPEIDEDEDPVRICNESIVRSLVRCIVETKRMRSIFPLLSPCVRYISYMPGCPYLLFPVQAINLRRIGVVTLDQNFMNFPH